ncbi:YncE family protein [Paenibacillus piscarius]|uniref:YncE family protein n=1 Tax=Paenibacillus piscarius TaxID=1089681 RepID=UPI001EE942DF|nr:hypothetical protein [Paenibacillus piscarius]
MSTSKASQRRDLLHALNYVYVSYVTGNKGGYIALINPRLDSIDKRIPAGLSPSALSLSPSGDKLYVTDDRLNKLIIYRTDNFTPITEVAVGAKPVAVFVTTNSKKAYAASYDDGTVTIVDGVTNKLIKTVSINSLNPSNPGKPFAFASNKNSPYVYVACKSDSERDYVIVIDIDNDQAYPLDHEPLYPKLKFDQTRNPLAVHPDGQNLITFGTVGYVTNFKPYHSVSATTALLGNTASGIYLNNKFLYSTLQGEGKFLNEFVDLKLNSSGRITAEHYSEFPSYNGQDKIRTSLSQKYVAVTIQPVDLPTGGLQIINTDYFQSELVPLNIVGDMTIYADNKAYVGEINAVRPINLGTATALSAIPIGGDDTIVRNIVYNYHDQSQ